MAFRALLTPLLIALLSAGCGSSGSLGGKVMADGAPLAGQQVVLQGANRLATATTGTDGSYSFKDLEPQSYLVSVDVPSTVERHEQVAVTVDGAVELPDLVFSGVGTLTGTVTDSNKAPVADAQVQLLGTQLSAATDAQGRFTLSAVPAGKRTLVAVSGAARAQADVTLALGETKDVALALTAPAPVPGTISGNVSFFSNADPTLIEISVPAAGVSTHAGADGSYSLALPAGAWDLYAQAPYYPLQKIARVSMDAGQTSALPPYALSLYTPLPTLGVSGASWSVTSSSLHYSSRKAVLLTLAAPSSASAYYAFDLATHALRPVSVGARPVLSPDGAHAALLSPSPSTLLIEDVGGANAFTVALAGNATDYQFSDDGSSVRVLTAGSPGKVYVVTLSDRSVASADVYDSKSLGTDRLLVRTTNAAPYNWSLATSSGITSAFTNVSTPSTATDGHLGLAYAVEACATAPCPVDFLGTTSTRAVRLAGVTTSGTPGLVSWAGTWAALNVGTVTLVNGADGSVTPLPNGGSGVLFSPDGTRVVFSEGGKLFEHALPLPDPSTLTPVLTSPSPADGQWLSFTRFVGFSNDTSAGPAFRFVLDSGVLTKDTDYTANSEQRFAGRSPAWAWRGSDGKIRLQSGTGDVFRPDPNATTAPSWMATGASFVSAGGLGVTSPGARAVTGWGNSGLWLFSGSGTPRLLQGYTQPPVLFYGSLVAVSDGTQALFVDADTGQPVNLQEPGVLWSTRSADQSAADLNAFFLVNGIGPGGTPLGGGYNLLPTVAN